MKRFSTLAFVAAHTTGAFAQGFWAPGACWIYEQLHVSHYLSISTYTGDTFIEGFQAQERALRICHLNWNGGGGLDTNCVSDIWHFRDYVHRQGDIVYHMSNYSTDGWDTLYYLGVPGDRWWPAHYQDPSTCGTFGMLQIQDTGQVVIDGVALQTWSLAYLDSAGTSTWGNEQFLGSDTMAVIDRIGGVFPAYGCIPPIDPPAYRLLHYSDWQMTTGGGLACDLVLSSPTSRTSHYSLSPNPGTDHFTVSAPSSISVEVRDALGRVVLNTTRLNPGQQVSTAGWPQGTYFVSTFTAIDERNTRRWVKQ